MEKVKVNLIEEDKELIKYKEEYLTKIKNDQDFMNLIFQNGLNDKDLEENVGKFIRFYEDYQINKELKKYEDCKKRNKFFKYVLYKKDSFIEERYEEMDVYHRYMAYNSLFIYKDFDIDELYSLTFKDINKQKVKLGLDEFIKSDNSLCYIYGSHNGGKSFAAIVLSNYYARKLKKKIAFIDVKKRFAEIRDNYFKARDLVDEFISTLSKVDVLVLDSLGEEYRNEITRDSILIPILNERCKNKKLITIITTPYSLEEFKQVYTFKDKNTLQANQILEFLHIMKIYQISTGKLEI